MERIRANVWNSVGLDQRRKACSQRFLALPTILRSYGFIGKMVDDNRDDDALAAFRHEWAAELKSSKQRPPAPLSIIPVSTAGPSLLPVLPASRSVDADLSQAVQKLSVGSAGELTALAHYQIAVLAEDEGRMNDGTSCSSQSRQTATYTDADLPYQHYPIIGLRSGWIQMRTRRTTPLLFHPSHRLPRRFPHTATTSSFSVQYSLPRTMWEIVRRAPSVQLQNSETTSCVRSQPIPMCLLCKKVWKRATSSRSQSLRIV